jgi:hypothetical protein
MNSFFNLFCIELLPVACCPRFRWRSSASMTMEPRPWPKPTATFACCPRFRTATFACCPRFRLRSTATIVLRVSLCCSPELRLATSVNFCCSLYYVGLASPSLLRLLVGSCGWAEPTHRYYVYYVYYFTTLLLYYFTTLAWLRLAYYFTTPVNCCKLMLVGISQPAYFS